MSEGTIPASEKRKFEAFSKPLIDLPVSRVWRGYGSALFFEFGKLTPHILKSGRKLPNDRGEMGLAITWSWRIEDETSIVAGSWSDEEDWNKYFERLIGSRVTNICLFGRLPEVQLAFSNGMYLCSMMTADGDPAWWISKRNPRPIQSVSVASGCLQWESSEDETTMEKS